MPRPHYIDLLEATLQGCRPDRGNLVTLLDTDDPEELAALFDAAYKMKLRYVGNIVRLRGLIEISNICAKNCHYCGIRGSNRVLHRYTMTREEVLSAAGFALECNYGSVVLQAGERCDGAWIEWIAELIGEIKQLSAGKLGITLSLGEQTAATYRRWFEAGAHRYLLRIESSNPELYAKMHPADHLFARREQCLEYLSEIGYQVGTGVMTGLPGQDAGDLADDVFFFRHHDVDMIGLGPYIPHPGTPMGRRLIARFDPAKALLTARKMIAVTRLVLRDVNIASTTALQALAPDGREQGLLSGANVIMPNMSPTANRADYELYANKPGLDENAGETRAKLERAIASIGEKIGYGEWGDSPHALGKKSHQQ